MLLYIRVTFSRSAGENPDWRVLGLESRHTSATNAPVVLSGSVPQPPGFHVPTWKGWGTSEAWDPGGPGEDRTGGLSPGSPVSTARLCERPRGRSRGPDAPALPGAGVSAQARVEVLAGDLRFSKLSLEDSGMYQCVAENKHGTIYASAELAVQGKGPRERGCPQGHAGGGGRGEGVRNSEQRHVYIRTLTWQFSNSF